MVLCEGETEEQYFKGFRKRGDGVALEVKKSGDRNADGIVEEAAKMACEDEYNQIWAVFDTENEDVSRARSRAASLSKEVKGADVRTSVSHPSFEVWLLLHHVETEKVGGIRQPEDFENLLKEVLPHWKKGPWDTRRNQGTRFEDFRSGVEDACRRAERIGAVRPGGRPATDVHEFVRAKQAGFPASSEAGGGG